MQSAVASSRHVTSIGAQHMNATQHKHDTKRTNARLGFFIFFLLVPERSWACICICCPVSAALPLDPDDDDSESDEDDVDGDDSGGWPPPEELMAGGFFCCCWLMLQFTGVLLSSLVIELLPV